MNLWRPLLRLTACLLALVSLAMVTGCFELDIFDFDKSTHLSQEPIDDRASAPASATLTDSIGGFLATAFDSHGGPAVAGSGNGLLIGVVGPGSQPGLAADGTISFSLWVMNFAGSGTMIDVSVPSTAQRTHQDAGGMAAPVDAPSALAVLHSSPFLVEVEGSAPMTAGSFIADIGLYTFDAPANAPWATLPNNFVMGQVAPGTQAVQNAAGDIEFQLAPLNLLGLTMLPMNVVVSQSAIMESYVASGLAVDITVAEALVLLNNTASPPLVEVEGLTSPMGLNYTGDFALRFFDGSVVGGFTPQDVVQGTIQGSAILGANGEIYVTVFDWFSGNIVDITIPDGSFIELFDTTKGTSSHPSGLSVVAAINAGVMGIEVWGTFDSTGLNLEAAEVYIDK